MKKLVFLIGVIMLVGCINAYAIPGKRIMYGQVSTSTNTYIPVKVDSDGNLQAETSISATNISVAANATPFSVSASSNTATQLRAANTSRVSILFENEGTQNIFLSTYAATGPVFSSTSTSGIKRLAASKTFSDSITPYSGAWFALTTAGQSPQVVGGIETSQ